LVGELLYAVLALEVFMLRSVAACSMIPLAVAVLAGCPDRSIDEVKPQQGRVEAKDIPVVINRDIDLLFVIDNSPSMADKQANLADNFPRFIDVLESIPGGLPNVHIGVVTSDMGTQGLADMNPNFGPGIGLGGAGACSEKGQDGTLQKFTEPLTGNPFIVDTVDPDPTKPRIRNYSGDLATAFGNIAKAVGAQGCGFEQHLAAAQRALVNPANAGFLRPDAYLAVIIVADEDDCSLQHYSLLATDNASNAKLGELQSFRCTRFGVICDQDGSSTDQMNQVGTKSRCHPSSDTTYLAPIDDFVTKLRALKPNNPNKVIVAGILGTVDRVATELRVPLGEKFAIPALAHSCSYVDRRNMTEVADPPIRIKAFLDQFPNRSTFVPICQNDLSGGLQQIGDLLKTVIGDPCIEGKLQNFGTDADPKYDCSVSTVTNPGSNNPMEAIMPACPAATAGAPCWSIIKDAAKCPMSPGNLVLKIQNDGQLMAPGIDVHVLANCVTQSQ
jgi:hypothetical protein